MSDQKTVLIVDDVETIRESLGMALEMRDFRVVFATNGTEALNLLKKEKIDFVLSDIRMPGMDGVELVKKIRETYPKIPVVLLMSGYTDVTSEQAKALGAIGIVDKPFEISKIVEMFNKK